MSATTTARKVSLRKVRSDRVKAVFRQLGSEGRSNFDWSRAFARFLGMAEAVVELGDVDADWLVQALEKSVNVS